jgi:uncharacterized membrane protein YphA (DoxX/SURF4 family)
MLGLQDLAIALQALVAAAILFVWVVRYSNIVAEFQQYRLPDWLRDLVGILKVTLSVMLLIGIDRRGFAIGGGLGLSLLMAAAFATHLRVKNPIGKMLPSLTLLALSILIVVINYRLQTG